MRKAGKRVLLGLRWFLDLLTHADRRFRVLLYSCSSYLTGIISAGLCTVLEAAFPTLQVPLLLASKHTIPHLLMYFGVGSGGVVWQGTLRLMNF